MARPRAVTSEVYTLDLDGMSQSCVDVSDPTRLHFDYVRRIGDVLDRMPSGPLRVLHIGGAAMTLPRYVAARRPGSAQIVLEPDQGVIDQVRAEVPLPPRSGIKVRAIDGLAGVAAVREDSQDVVILDAFREGVVPAELVTAAFLADVRRVLGESGILIANVADRAPFALVRTFVAGVRQVWGASAAMTVGAEPATLKAKRPGNLIVVVSSGQAPVLDQPFGEPSPTAYRIVSGTAVSDSFGGGRAT